MNPSKTNQPQGTPVTHPSPPAMVEWGTADSALADPSGAGGSVQARYPQTAHFVSNVSARGGEVISSVADLQFWK
jgi:hypothetical protein